MASDLDLLIQLGQDITSFKYYAVATGTILFYDYFLTLGDEIKYYWTGNKSWTFWLFIINRYFPMSFQFWHLAVAYPPQTPQNTRLCNQTAWYGLFVFTICTLIAQIAVTVRIYAVTKANIVITAAFAAITITVLGLGTTLTAYAIRDGAQVIPPIPFDSYHLCAFASRQHRTLEIVAISASLLYDFLAFMLVASVAVTAKAQGFGISKVLTTIVQDSARYFLVIFTSHFALEMTLALGRESIQLLPGTGNVVYLPMMVSRIMISLRKAVDTQQQGGWSLADISGSGETTLGLEFLRPWRGGRETQDDIPLHSRADTESTLR